MQIFEEVRSQPPLYQIKASSQVYLMLAELLSFEHRKEHPDYSRLQQIVEKVKIYLWKKTFTKKLIELFRNFSF
jgi:hypothetical protein